MTYTAIDVETAVHAHWVDLDPDTKETVVRYYASQGLTAAAIATEMDTTKNAVLGLCHRRKIAIGADVPVTAFSARVARPVFARGKEVDNSTWEPLGPTTSSPTRHQCRWPVGEATGSAQMFCGMPRARQSYCADHAKMAYAPRRGDVAYSEKLMGPGRSVPPEVSIEEAVALVLGKVKAEVEE